MEREAIDMEKLKLCFSTLPCMDYTAAQLKETCEQYGMSGVEVRYSDNGFVYSQDLNVVDIGTSICLLGYDKNRIMEGKKILDEIAETNIRAIRVFLGNFAVYFTMAKKEVDYSGIVRALQELADYTEKEIWIETHNEFARGRVLKMLLEDVNRKNVKIIWDIIHPWEDGEKPSETIAHIGDKIAHVHIKDGKRSVNPLKHDLDYTVLGEGELPIKEIITTLVESGYTGYFSLEWESLWRNEIQNCFDNVGDVLKMYRNYLERIL